MEGEARGPLAATLQACRRALAQVGLLSLAINLLMLVPAIYMLQLFDRVLQTHSLATLAYLSLVAALALVVLGLLDAIRARILVRIGTWIDRRLAGETLERGIVAGLRGEAYQTRALQDLQELRNAVGSPTLVALLDAPWVPFYLLVIWALHPLMALVASVGAVVLFGLALVNERLTRPALAGAGESAARSGRLAQAALRNAEAVEAMGMGRAVVDRWLASNARTLQLQEQAADRSGVILAMTKLWRLGVQMGIMATGAWLILRQELGPGAMIAGSILMGRALAPVEGAIGNWKVVVNARAAWQRLRRLLEQPEVHPVRLSLPAPQGRLKVDNLWYAYPPSQAPTLRGVGFELEPGEVLAIVGPSAAGKSTLARLLIGLYEPSRGTVRLDGARLGTWDSRELGRWIGYLPQDVELFAGTVRDNIARLGEAGDAAVLEAARLADVHAMVLELPQGYDSEIGEGGRMLSAGQRQRLGLARAMFGPPRLLVLDEPNSNLDQEGEAALNRAILAIKRQGTTVVLIAHRPSLLAHVDKILVLRQGAVEALGKRDEILKQITRPGGLPRVARPRLEEQPPAAAAAGE